MSDEENPFLRVAKEQTKGGIRIARTDKAPRSTLRKLAKSGGRAVDQSVNWDALFNRTKKDPAPVLREGKPLLSRRYRRTQEDNPGRRVIHGVKCPYCGASYTEALEQPRSKTVDHVWPRSRFPEKCNSVLADCCRRCNGQKGNFTLEEWLEVLIRSGDPRVPYVQKCLEVWKL